MSTGNNIMKGLTIHFFLLATALQNKGQVLETSRSFHIVDGDHFHDWQILPTQPWALMHKEKTGTPRNDKTVESEGKGQGESLWEEPWHSRNTHENVHQKSTVRVHLSARADYKGQTSVCCC